MVNEVTTDPATTDPATTDPATTDPAVTSQPPRVLAFRGFHNKRGLAVSIGILILSFAAFVWFGAEYPNLWLEGDVPTWIAPVAAIVACLATGAAVYLTFGFRVREVSRTISENAARVDVEQAEASVAADADTSIAQVWRVTQLRIGLYHQQALAQSRTSFRNAWISGSAGLVVLAVCAFIAVQADSASGAITVGVLGTVGAAMSGYIGATFLRSQDLVARQSQTYFEQASDAWRYLSAERLLDRIKSDSVIDSTASAMARSIVAGAGAGLSSASPTDDEPLPSEKSL